MEGRALECASIASLAVPFLLVEFVIFMVGAVTSLVFPVKSIMDVAVACVLWKWYVLPYLEKLKVMMEERFIFLIKKKFSSKTTEIGKKIASKKDSTTELRKQPTFCLPTFVAHSQ